MEIPFWFWYSLATGIILYGIVALCLTFASRIKPATRHRIGATTTRTPQAADQTSEFPHFH